MENFDLNEISYLVVPLPEDIQRAKDFGDFQLTRKLIHSRIDSPKTSQVLKNRLQGELEVLRVLDSSQYPFDEKEAIAKMADAFSGFETAELDTLIAAGEVEWIYVNGEKYFHTRFIENLVKTKHDYYARYQYDEGNTIDNERQTELDDNIRIMKAQKKRTARITLKQSLTPLLDYTDTDGPFLAHLPLPRANGGVSNFKVLETKGPVLAIDASEATQRTIAFQTENANDLTFGITHQYDIEAIYTDLFATMDNKTEQPCQLTEVEKNLHQEYLNEKAPHIMFTPFLEGLLAEIVDQEASMVERAFAIYKFVTTQVTYSFVREYYAIENISEYCAVNQKGDCGVQALLFITLCRMSGIPAKWESGLYVSEYTVGPHDWAKFYLPNFGWVYADASFGGSAYRGNNDARWKYYFGNLDIYRLPANNDIQAGFKVEKKQLRADPIDNQRGEFETKDIGLKYEQLDCRMDVLKFELINE